MIRECGSVVFAPAAPPVAPRPPTASGQSSCGPSRPPWRHARPSGCRNRGRSVDRVRPTPHESARAGPAHRTTPPATGHRVDHRTGCPRQRRRLRPEPGSPRRAARGCGWRRTKRPPRAWCRRSRPDRCRPDRPSRTTPTPARTTPRSRPGDGAGTGPAWRDQVADWRPAPDTQHRQRDAARSAATNAPQCNTVHQNAEHHRRVIHRAAAPVDPELRVERRQIQLDDYIKHEPHQMVLRQPIGHRRRHQKQLLAIPSTNVHGHDPSSPANPNAGGIVGIRATASFVSASSPPPSPRPARDHRQRR